MRMNTATLRLRVPEPTGLELPCLVCLGVAHIATVVPHPTLAGADTYTYRCDRCGQVRRLTLPA